MRTTALLRPAIAALLALAALTGGALAENALAQDAPGEEEFDPSTLDLQDIVACTITTPEWNAFAFWFHDNEEALKHYGLTRIETGNPFLSDYRLATPISIFDRETDRIAFTSSGLMAVLPEVKPQELAEELGVEPAVDVPGKYMGERVIDEHPFDGGSPAFQGTERITLNVSTVSSHPGAVLAGCSYRITFPE